MSTRPSLAISVFALLFSSVLAQAAPYRGAVRTFDQPDGSRVEVRLFGTELYLRAESVDGYTVVRDKDTGFFCYAEEAADGGLRSTGLVVRGLAEGDALDGLARRGVVRHLRASSAYVTSIVEGTRQALQSGPLAGRARVAHLAARKYNPTLGSGKGLVVLVDFSDRPGTIPVSEYDKAFNGETYDTLGSIRTWIESISYSKYTASHTVVGYMRAAYPTSHYTGGAEWDYSATTELMKQVFAYIDKNVDLTSYATNGAMPSLVVIYPGAEIAKTWATGLWPHAGEGGYTTSEGVEIPNAFISNGGTKTPVDLDTFRHELGHSLFSWPDTYDYDDDSQGAGGYATETTLPCAPFRMWSGWLNVTELVGANQSFSLAANGDTCLRYQNASLAREYFVVEAMRRDSVKRADAPDEGLLIWHVDESGDNSYQDMTPTKHFELSVEQADGLFDLEKNRTGRANDLFHAGNKDRFDDTTSPNSKWWNGSASGFRVCNVGPVGPSIALTVGCSGDAGVGGGGAAGAGGVTGAGGIGGSGGAGGSGRDGGVDRPDSAGDVADVSATGGNAGFGGAGGVSSGGASGSGGTVVTGGSSAGGANAAGGVGGKASGSGGNGVSVTGGASGAGGNPAVGGSTVSGGSAGGGGAGHGGSTGGATKAGPASQSGCSCALGGARSSDTGMAALLGAAVVWGIRRRKRSVRRAQDRSCGGPLTGI